MKKIRIRKATVRDFEQLRDLKREFYLFEGKMDHLSRKDYAYNGLPQHLGKSLRSKNVAYFVAEKNKEIIGYAGAQIEKCPAWKLSKKRVHIFNIFMKKPYRKKGIGRKLVHASAKWAKSKGIKQLVLYTYWWNQRAKKLYDDLGFKLYVYMMVKPR